MHSMQLTSNPGIYGNIGTYSTTAIRSSVRSSARTLRTADVKCLRLPARSPNLNAFSERWVRSVKSECHSKLILFGESSLRRALTNFCEHYDAERPHQGKGNVLLFPTQDQPQTGAKRVLCNNGSAA